MKTLTDLKQEIQEPVLLADHHGLITYVNKRFEEVFGWQTSEIVGKPLTTIIPKTFHEAHHLGFSRFLMTGKPTLINQPINLKAITKNGREFDAEHLIVAEQELGQWVFGAIVRPLVEK